jgi:hypothetical protein
MNVTFESINNIIIGLPLITLFLVSVFYFGPTMFGDKPFSWFFVGKE